MLFSVMNRIQSVLLDNRIFCYVLYKIVKPKANIFCNLCKYVHFVTKVNSLCIVSGKLDFKTCAKGTTGKFKIRFI